MYEAFWRLERPPFVVTPDVRFLLRARSHHESLLALLTGIARETGVMVLVGDVGTGKTLLCRALCAELSEDVSSVLVINPYLSGAELVGAILDDLGVARAGSTHGELMAALAHHLLAVGAAQASREEAGGGRADHAVNPRHACAEGYQREHVEVAVCQRCPAALEEGPPGP